MPLFDSRQISATVMVGLLTAVAIAFAVIGYVEWSSNAAWAEFMSATSASDLDHSSGSSTPILSIKGPTGCPVGTRKLPTQLMPLP